MDELPLNDERKPAPRKGTVAWFTHEWSRFRTLSAQHGGLTTSLYAGIAIGVSRQRADQLAAAGRIVSYDILGKRYLACDSVEDIAKQERLTGRPRSVATGSLATA
jgi:hypothetical protein